ncbi:biotin--[acetyl-CoA-carboxylase] ligase [Polycladidibacter stylochi]|uniref:biotin--[acetyl-CoA-carboxylase] ligase n=1 Tax=Polycladidibacter stylochi TaxID=1807766 RepID=UPI001AD8AF4D|nr:biotin--[acetyl-CoA-carboxylase] ligase [Pseudovibrio stylochi]
MIHKGPVRSAPGFFVEHYHALDSTNLTALDKARAGYPADFWVVADQQLKGRARRGRSWTSEPGNLFASVILKLENPQMQVMQLPFVAALALADAVEELTGCLRLVELKWPNDLLIGSKKISGILLESENNTKDGMILVCGFGVNCAHHPDLGLYPATNLKELGYRVSAELLFDALAKHFHRWREIWLQADGFMRVRESWRSRAIGIGKSIEVRLINESFKGVFQDIDQYGRLITIDHNGKERLVSAGDVFFS